MTDIEFIVEPGRHDMVMRREFDAPRELVYRAYTDPELIPRWWGPRRLETIVEELDPRSGGRWRFVNREPDGQTYGFWGVYHEATAPARLVSTFEFEGAAGHVVLETATFEDIGGGRSRLTTRSVFESVEDRDAATETGMIDGARETFERLGELVEKLR